MAPTPTAGRALAATVVAVPSRLFHAFVSHPAWLFLVALTVILFRPPDLQLYEMDRIAVLALTYFVVVRALVRKQSFRIFDPVSLPLLGLTVLASVAPSASLTTLKIGAYSPPSGWCLFCFSI